MGNFSEKLCVECGNRFAPTSARVQFCSLRCRLVGLIVIIPNGCWIWNGQTDKGNYGRIKWADKKISAHRSSYEVWIGKIPPGMLVCHSCDNPECVNPNHLWLGTQQDNVADMIAKGRKATIANGRHSRSAGRGHPKKLTDNDVIGIRASSMSYRKIAKDYGISHAMVGYIKNHQSWKHIKENPAAKII